MCEFIYIFLNYLASFTEVGPLYFTIPSIPLSSSLSFPGGFILYRDAPAPIRKMNHDEHRTTVGFSYLHSLLSLVSDEAVQLLGYTLQWVMSVFSVTPAPVISPPMIIALSTLILVCNMVDVALGFIYFTMAERLEAIEERE